MGAEILYFTPNQKPPEKHQFKLTFSDNTGFTIHFWWFGYIHLIPENSLSKHKLAAQLGMSPTEETFTLQYFQKLVTNKRVRVKNLINQKNTSGIGNVYMQDILFKAKLHPNRKISDLSDKEISMLYSSIVDVLNHSIRLGGLACETEFYGQRGKLTVEKFLVSYKTGKPCPVCKTHREN